MKLHSILLLPLLTSVCSLSPGRALAFPARCSVMNSRSTWCAMSVVDDDSITSSEREDSIARNSFSRRSLMHTGLSGIGKATALVTLSATFLYGTAASARPEPVNRPDLLPKESGLNVIQIEKFLTSGQAKRLSEQLAKLEQDTGFRVRVLCQAYPQTPGLAIRDYWDLGKEGQKDDKYIVLVVDQFGGRGNVLNFNVGEGVKFALPNVFWTRLSGKYGSTFFVRENGIDQAILTAIDAINQCLRAEYCVSPPEAGPSLKSLGF